MEVAPWIKDYVVDMDDLYTELSVEQIDNKPIGEENTRLKDYKELFDEHLEIDEDEIDESTKLIESTQQTGFLTFLWHMLNSLYFIMRSILALFKGDAEVAQSKIKKDTIVSTRRKRGRKVLLKGEPGMGKTSICKKMAWDWSKGLFTKFYITFVAFLKLVKPDDKIANVIIEQNIHFQGLNFNQQKIHNILEFFGDQCLLILDGLDEHALGTNRDVLEIIKGQKYFSCNIILTSRPHSSSQVKQYCSVIAKVDGFTEMKAKQFASKILDDRKKIRAVLNFNPVDRNVPIYKCPILLSFMCLLIREDDDIDLSDKTMHVGKIYYRMVRCLYKKFLIRKGQQFEETIFHESIARIGKIALRTLVTGNPLVRRSDIIREVGPDAFDYGLLIGHEDFRLIRDETADIFVTFPHRSIQEFLGAFFFVWMFVTGEILERRAAGEANMLLKKNLLFLQFCLWLAK